MTHCHLSFQLAYCFKDYTNYDKKCGTAEGNSAEKTVGYCVEYKRNASDNAEEECSHKDYLVENLFDILCSRLAGTNTGDKAALLHKVVGNLNGVKGNRNIEVSKCYNKNKEEYDVNRACRIEQVLNYIPKRAFFERACKSFYEVKDCRNKRYDRACKDDRHNTGHIEFDREVGVLTAIHLTAYNFFSILNGNSSFRIGHICYKYERCNYDEECENTEHPLECNVDFAGLEHCNLSCCDRRNTGYDIREKYHRDTVADALLVDLFTEPHDERGTCCKASNHYDSLEHDVCACRRDKVVAVEQEEVTDGRDNSENDRSDTSDLIDLLSACFAVFGHSFESGNSNCEKLNDDLRVNVRCYRKRKKCGLCECIAGEDIEVLENTLCHRSGYIQELCVVYKRYGYCYTDTVQRNDQEREKDFRANLAYFPCVSERLEHVIPPRTFRLLLRFSL